MLVQRQGINGVIGLLQGDGGAGAFVIDRERAAIRDLDDVTVLRNFVLVITIDEAGEDGVCFEITSARRCSRSCPSAWAATMVGVLSATCEVVILAIAYSPN